MNTEDPKEKLDSALAGAAKVAKDTNTMARAPITCKCGRYPRIIPETGKLTKHRIGKLHPSYSDISCQKRKEMWCPEVSD
jgi:hypothetical protein